MIKKIVVGILSILFSCLLFGLLVFYVFQYTVMNKDYIKKSLAKSNYYAQIYKVILDDFAGYAPQLHIGDEETILNDIVSKKQVEGDINHLIDSIYVDKKIDIDTTFVKNALDSKIDGILSKYNKVPTLEEKKSLEEFENTIIDSYKNQVLISIKYLPKLVKGYKMVNSIVPTIWKVLIFLNLIFLFLIIFLEKNLKMIIRSMGICFLTVAFLAIFVRSLCYDRIAHILIFNKAVSIFFVYIMQDMLIQLFYLSIILGIIGFFGIILCIDRK